VLSMYDDDGTLTQSLTLVLSWCSVLSSNIASREEECVRNVISCKSG
jgi:hypothetical protein